MTLTEISNYDIKNELGHGQFGIVLKVKDKRDKAEYSLKYFRTEISLIPKALKEAEVLANLNHNRHQNIVNYFHTWVGEYPMGDEFPILDVEDDDDEDNGAPLSKSSSGLGTSEGSSSTSSISNNDSRHNKFELENYAYLQDPCIFIKMELCDMNLREWVENYPKYVKNLKTMLDHFIHISVAVKLIHKNEIVHRDLKPENILVKRYGQNGWLLKIGDFGNVKIGMSFRKNRRSLHDYDYGTFPYAPPPSPSGTGTKIEGYKNDVYSIGMIFLELLFQTKTLMELNQLKNDLFLEPEKNPAFISHSFEVNQIKKMLDPVPELRCSSGAFHNWLKNFKGGKLPICVCHTN